jgi:hypothetical protein
MAPASRSGQAAIVRSATAESACTHKCRHRDTSIHDDQPQTLGCTSDWRTRTVPAPEWSATRYTGSGVARSSRTTVPASPSWAPSEDAHRLVVHQGDPLEALAEQPSIADPLHGRGHGRSTLGMGAVPTRALVGVMSHTTQNHGSGSPE